MKRFLFKIWIYVLLILLVSEGLVRLFHLHKGTPERIIDERNVEKWIPGQTGYVATGNRRQNFSEYRINDLGFNSYREFAPTSENFEIALIGDSFIEGFHQDYDRSLGKKIESRLPDSVVYEFGYAGYDLADEIHLIQAYPELFEKIDRIFIYMHYPDDLFRGRYEVSQERMKLQRGYFALLQKSKLLVYLQNIGFLNSISGQIFTWKNRVTGKKQNSEKPSETADREMEQRTLQNLKQLFTGSGIDWNKTVLLLDEALLPDAIRDYLETKGIPYVDYGSVLRGQEHPVTLIYDKHWNDFGRELVAQEIVKHLKAMNKEASPNKKSDTASHLLSKTE